MSWFPGFTLLVRSSWSSFIEKVENPERMLHQLILDMEEELDGVRASVAEAIADEIRLGKEAAAREEDADLWGKRARETLTRGDEASARAALGRRLDAEKAAEASRRGHARQVAEVARLEERLRDLESKLGEARQRRTLLAARLAATRSTRALHDALERAGDGSALRQFRRLEERIERDEALLEAHERLAGKDPAAERLRRDLEAREREESIEREMAGLRRGAREADAGGEGDLP